MYLGESLSATSASRFFLNMVKSITSLRENSPVTGALSVVINVASDGCYICKPLACWIVVKG